MEEQFVLTPLTEIEELKIDEEYKSAFCKHAQKKFVSEQFLFFEMYQNYLEKFEIDEEKESLEEELYEKFINQNSKTALTLSTKILKKVKNLYKEKASKPFQIVYQEVNTNLSPIYREFLKNNNEMLIKKESIFRHPSHIPKNFEEIIDHEELYQIFCNYVCDHYGRNYMVCFEDLREYQRNPIEKAKNRIYENYFVYSSRFCCIFNPQIRSTIFINKNTTTENWEENLENFLKNILQNEFFVRFIHSPLWKDFISSNFQKEKDTTFDDLYTVKKVVKKTTSFSEEVEHLIVVNKLTTEPFNAKRITSTKTLSKIETFNSMNQRVHDNVIQFVELFKEDLKEYNKNCVTIITTEINERLDTFLNNKGNIIKEYEIIGYFMQILSALAHLHDQKRYFDFGTLCENNIYMSALYSTIFIDPGYYFDEENDEYPDYYDAPENVTSAKGDIYSAGFIFFRFLTRLSPEEIETIYKKKPNLNLVGKIKSFRRSPFNGVEPTYYNNIKETLSKVKLFDSKIKDLVLQMIHPDHKKRPSALEAHKTLKAIQKGKNYKMIKTKSMVYENFEEEHLLTKNIYRRFFKEFVRTEFSTETVLFFEDVELFQNFSTDQERLLKTKEIFQSYLSSSSPLEINVSGRLKKKLEEEIQEANETGDITFDIFDEIQKHM
eukprot:gene3305-5746_t